MVQIARNLQKNKYLNFSIFKGVQEHILANLAVTLEGFTSAKVSHKFKIQLQESLETSSRDLVWLVYLHYLWVHSGYESFHVAWD